MNIIEQGLLQGDSLELLTTLPKNFFQLILADPPYEISRPNNFTGIGRQGIDFGDWDKNFNQLSWIDLAAPLLKPGGSIVIFNDWKKLGDIAKHLESLKFNSMRPIIWHKSNPAPFNGKYMFLQSTEFAIWATKKKKGKNSKTVFNSKYHHGIFNYSNNNSKKKGATGVKHPTKKSLDMFQEIIRILTNPNDWVLDPFLGSGTTAVACKKTGRNVIGIEKDPNFYKMGLDNWTQAKFES